MKRLIPSFIVLTSVIVSFKQKIYLVQRRTLAYDSNRIQAGKQNENVAVCSVWRAFEMTYFIMMGDGVLDRAREDGEEKSQAVLMGVSLAFAAFVGLVLLQIIGTTIITSTSYGSNTFMLDKYWVPMMTFVLLLQSFDSFMCGQDEKLSSNNPFERQTGSHGGDNSNKPCCSSLESKLHFIWESVCKSTV